MSCKGKTLPGETRRLVFNIMQFALREKEAKRPIIELEKAMERVVAMTGLSRQTLTRIKKEGKVNGGVWCTPGGKRTGRPKIELHDLDKMVVRDKIHEFYKRKEDPTLRKLWRVLKEDIEFRGSVDTLRRILMSMGFRYIQTAASKKKVLTECTEEEKLQLEKQGAKNGTAKKKAVKKPTPPKPSEAPPPPVSHASGHAAGLPPGLWSYNTTSVPPFLVDSRSIPTAADRSMILPNTSSIAPVGYLNNRQGPVE